MSRFELHAGEIVEAIDAQSAVIDRTLTFVHDHPELAHEEHECAGFLGDALADGGLEVERGLADMGTAFRATLACGSPGPTVGVVAVFDAVPGRSADGSPEPIHACGHGPISAGVVGAARALASVRDRLAGRFVVVGCPADEIHAPGTVARGPGKALTAAAGVWDDVDVALYAHPEFIDTVSLESQWMRRERLVVAGTRSLRADTMQQPLLALTALLTATQSYEPAHVMLESLVLDGDVEEGSALRLDADVLIIDASKAAVDARAERLRADVPHGAWEAQRTTPGIQHDPQVTSFVAEAFRSLGRSFEPDPPPLPFATDFGEISRRVPSALIGVGRPEGWMFHTPAGAAEFTSMAGRSAAYDLARVVAMTGAGLLATWSPDRNDASSSD